MVRDGNDDGVGVLYRLLDVGVEGDLCQVG